MPNYVDPSVEAFDFLKSLPRDTPVHMLNLLRYREKADYPPDHPLANKGWTGRQAFEEYGRTAGPIFARVGAQVIWHGTWEAMVIGPDDEYWENALIAAYPNADCFLELMTDPVYREAVVNRSAAILDSRLIRFSPAQSGEGFD